MNEMHECLFVANPLNRHLLNLLDEPPLQRK